MAPFNLIEPCKEKAFLHAANEVALHGLQRIVGRMLRDPRGLQKEFLGAIDLRG